MDLLKVFIGYLNESKDQPSPNTLKNYRADVAKFIHWYEDYNQTKFIPEKISLEDIQRYEEIRTNSQANSSSISDRSIKRHLSSLRKFFYFLKLEGKIIKNPFDQKDPNEKPEVDTWHLKAFKNYLYIYNSANLTIKNYIIDLKQFFHWAEEVSASKQSWNVKDKNILNKLDSNLVNEYKTRLIESGFSPLTINRRLSAIRRYMKWALEAGFIKNTLQAPAISLAQEITEKEIQPLAASDTLFSQIPSIPTPEIPTPNEFIYSAFPPKRLLQKTLRGLDILLEKGVINPVDMALDALEYKLWILQGKPLFKALKNSASHIPQIDPVSSLFATPIKNIEKAFYAPLSISLSTLPLHKKLAFYVRHKRPKWYKSYHRYALTHYMHFAVLIIFMSALGFGLHKTFFEDPRLKELLAAPIAPPRVLSFEGRLTDAADMPISTTKNLRFGIYSSEKASGSALLWQEIQDITPDSNGSFSVLLGIKTALSQSIFANNNGLWLGVTIDNDKELAPRQQLATVAFASNSELLQGMPPITQQSAGSKNVVLNLDSSGNLSMNNGAHTFQAIGGQFKLTGKELMLATNPGTNGNVVLSPDGQGNIDFQKPVINSTNNNNIGGVPGAVEIADMLSVLATASGQSALTINQNSTGAIVSASASGIAKFIVESNGDGFFAGDLKINNTGTAGAKLDIASSDSTHIKLTYLGNAYATLKVSKDGDLNIDSRGGDLSIPSRATIGSSTLGEAKLNVSGSEVGKALVILNETGDQALLTASASGITKFVIAHDGAVGIGTANPGKKLEVDGDIRTDLNGSQTLNALCHSGSGTSDQDIVDCSGAPSDSAEWYAANRYVEEGELVDLTDSAFEYESKGSDPKTGKVTSLGLQKIQIADKSRVATKLLGIVSTGPYQVFGEDIKDAIEKSNNPNIKAVPIALAGRVPTKVSLENGPIQFGDYLTTSSIPGIAAKATKPGPVVGMALESIDESKTYVCGDNKMCGKVLTFIKNTWYDPDQYRRYTALEFSQPSKGEKLNDKLDNVTDGIGGASNLAIMSIKAEFIIAKDLSAGNIKATQALIDQLATSLLTTQTLLASQKIVSPIVETDELRAHVISPLAENGDIALRFNKDTIEIGGIKASDAAVATFDTKGNATFSGILSAKEASVSGTLESNKLAVSSDATISGTLRARKIIADEIEGLPLQSTTSATYVTNVTNIYTATQSATPINSTTPLTPMASPSGSVSTPSALAQNIEINEPEAVPQSFLDEITTFTPSFTPINSIKAQFGTFEQGLVALGPSSFADLSVSGQLAVNKNFIIDNNSINVLGDTLELQPFRQGGISLLGGKIVIDTDGNATFFGNASFAQNVEVKGALSANIIKPIPNHDLVVSLDSKEATSAGNFVVTNASGSAVLQIDDGGTVTSSGSGQFADLFAKSFKIIRDAQADTSVTETVATASAGVATITAGYTYRTIITPHVKTNSLIYISPTSDTSGVNPYIASQVPFETQDESQPNPSGSFTIRIPKFVAKDISLNWWIVN